MNMNLTTAIQLRQANREFKATPVAPDQLAALSEAASYAPVARGRYNEYLLTVVTDRQVIDELEAADTGHPFYGAPVVMVLSTTLTNQAGYLSAGMIAQNIELKASELGLASCTILGALKGGIESSVAARTALGLPTDYVPVVAIAIGHPAHELNPRHFVTDRLRTITLTPDQA